ncbi:MAG: hypothetical protein SF028_10060 [Candidatus Sumerlaeia bacterium]|nr:hypothetical protein [Candidatus Sumerlaeia bacterium]
MDRSAPRPSAAWHWWLAAAALYAAARWALGGERVLDGPVGPVQPSLAVLRLSLGAAFALGFAGCGARLLALLRPGDAPPGERLAVAALLGYAAFGTAIAWLGLAGLLAPAGWIALEGALLWFAPAGLRAFGEAARGLPAWWRGEHPAARGAVVLAAALVAFRGFLAMAPPLAWDTLTYHFAFPWRVAESGSLRASGHAFQFAFPASVQLPYALAFRTGDAVVAQFVAFIPGVAALGAAALAARRAGGGTALAAALLGAVLTVPLLLQMGSGYVDWIMASGPAAVLLASSWTMERPRRAALFGGVLGFYLVGAKYTGAAILLPLGLAWAFSPARRLPQRAEVAPFLAAALLAALAWPLRNLADFGNPVHPAPLPGFPTPSLSATQLAIVSEWLRGVGPGRGWLDYLLLPVRLANAGGAGRGGFDGRVLATLLLLAVPLPGLRRHPLAVPCLAGWWAGVALWALGTQQLRFLFPVFPLLLVGAGASTTALLGYLRERRGPRAAGLLAALLLAEPALELASIGRFIPGLAREHAAIIAGRVAPEGFWRPHAPGLVALEVLAERHAGPEPPRVLMLFDNHTFQAPAVCIADGALQAPALFELAAAARTPGALHSMVKGRFAPEYVLVDYTKFEAMSAEFDSQRATPRTAAEGVLAARQAQCVRLVRRWLRGLGEPLLTEGPVAVYRFR